MDAARTSDPKDKDDQVNSDSAGGRHRQRGLRRMAVVAVLAAVLLAACSGGSHPAGAAATARPGNVQQVEAFAQCMRGQACHPEL
jgi:hypothetical protein